MRFSIRGGHIASLPSQFGSSYFMVNLQSNRIVQMTILRHNKNNEFHKNVRVVNVIGFFFYDCSIAFRPLLKRIDNGFQTQTFKVPTEQNLRPKTDTYRRSACDETSVFRNRLSGGDIKN